MHLRFTEDKEENCCRYAVDREERNIECIFLKIVLIVCEFKKKVIIMKKYGKIRKNVLN